jgi:cytochrome c553
VRPIVQQAARIVLGAAALLALASPAFAGDAKAGRQKALQCQTCHGLDGLSKLPEAPNLAGQIEPYLIKSLTEYKTGTRQNEMMSVVAPELSDEDIADLAAYYAGIQIAVTPPN